MYIRKAVPDSRRKHLPKDTLRLDLVDAEKVVGRLYYLEEGHVIVSLRVLAAYRPLGAEDLLLKYLEEM